MSFKMRGVYGDFFGGLNLLEVFLALDLDGLC